MRTRFDGPYIRSELERIGQQLDEPLAVFVIGGGSMAFRGLKDTTKDIDLTVIVIREKAILFNSP